MSDCPQCKSPVAREGQQFCYRCGQDLRSFYSAQGISFKGSEPEPPGPTPDSPETQASAPSAPEAPRQLDPPSDDSAPNPLEITSDSIKPSAVGEQKATLRILLPTGDLFDRELTRVETQLGKNPRNDLVIADSSVSTTHAVIRNDEGVYTVSDLGSRNGTYVNGERITEPRKLQHGDVIGLGLTKLTFRLSNHSETGAIDITVMLPAPGAVVPQPLTEESLAGAVVGEGLISEAEVQRLRGQAARGRRLYRALIEDGGLDQERLRDLMSRIFEIKVLDLGATPVDESLSVRFPFQLARLHGVFPVTIVGDKLILAVGDPTDSVAVEAAKRKSGRTVDLRLATSKEIDNLTSRFYGPKLIGVLPSGEKLEYPVVQAEIEIGKAPHNHIVLSDPTVSNTHAIILARDGGYNIVDLGSRNGTFVNGERLGDRAHILRHGDAIQLGQTVLTFRNEQETKENITATLSGAALEAVRKRAALASPPESANTPPLPVQAYGAGTPRLISPQPSDAIVPLPGEAPAVAPLSDAEAEAEKKKKKKKKKGDQERIKAAYIRAIGTILGPILSVAATVALTIYLMRPSSSPGPVIDTSPKGNARPKLGSTSAATPINGGPFEASGVVQVPGTDSVLFIDDNSPGTVFRMELDQSGKQAGPIKTIPLGVDVEDPEGITFDGNYFYALGSQSNPKAGDRNALVRFLIDPSSGALQGSAQVLTDLRRFLIENVPELKDLADVKGDDGGVNVEGIAWDPDHARLRLGFRSPVQGGLALVVSIKLRDPVGSFSVDNLQLAEPGAITKLSLGGLGIRDIQYDRRLKSFLIIAGAPEHGEKLDFSLWEWNGDSDQTKPESQPRKESAVLERNNKPEGVTNVRTSAGNSFIFIVGDASNYLKLEYSESQ